MRTDIPVYRILNPAGFFGPDDCLYAEGDEIYFQDEPNEEMEPLNDLARERMALYLDKLDKLAREMAEKLGKPYIGRPRSLDGALVLSGELERRVSLVKGDGGVPLMGAKRETAHRIGKAQDAEVPQTGGARIGRPPGSKNKRGNLSV